MWPNPFVPRPRLPVVLDTMILADDVLWACLQGRETALVAAARQGAIALFVGHHVPAEVERLLDWRAPVKDVSTQDALARWRQGHLPVLHVVDVPESWAADDPRVRQTVLWDVSDAPTARLVAALAPAYSFGRDKSLTVPGLAQGEWLPFALAAADRAAFHQGADGIGGAVVLTVAAVRIAMAMVGKVALPVQAAAAAMLLAGLVSWTRTAPGNAAVRRGGYGLLVALATIDELRHSSEVHAATMICVGLDRSPAEWSRPGWPSPVR